MDARGSERGRVKSIKNQILRIWTHPTLLYLRTHQGILVEVSSVAPEWVVVGNMMAALLVSHKRCYGIA